MKRLILAAVAMLIAAPVLASAIGTEHDGGPEKPGWVSLGGGLLEEPIWYHRFTKNLDAYMSRRADVPILVWVDWKLPPYLNSKYARFQVTDELIIPSVQKDYDVVFDCKPPQTNVSIRVFAVVRIVNNNKKWWRGSDIGQAWKIDLHDGKTSPLPVNGIACLNQGWGV